MNHDELLKCLYSQLESIAETLVLIQENEECTRRIKKILTNQIGMLVFCQKENFRDKNKDNKLKTYQKVINLNKNIDKIIKLL